MNEYKQLEIASSPLIQAVTAMSMRSVSLRNYALKGFDVIYLSYVLMLKLAQIMNPDLIDSLGCCIVCVSVTFGLD